MLSQQKKIVPVANELAMDPAASYTDGINMKNYHKATFICKFSAIGGADSHVWVYSGAAEAAYSSALEYQYAFGGAAIGSANCDVLAAFAANPGGSTPTALHITNATYSNYMLIIEVNAAKMDIANGEEWLSLGFLDTDGGATGNVTVIAILEPRFQGVNLTALT